MRSHDTTTATTAGGEVNAASNNSAPSDAQIFAVLTEANQAEIDAAKTALDKAKHADVKAFARQMLADHTKLLNGGKALADSLHVTPQPPANDSLATHVAQEKQQLSSVAAPTFDKTYMDAQVQDHQTVLALLKQFEGQAQDPRLKAMIAKAEPIVQRHLTRAQGVDAKLAVPTA
jgi:putative membrane protein